MQLFRPWMVRQSIPVQTRKMTKDDLIWRRRAWRAGTSSAKTEEHLQAICSASGMNQRVTKCRYYTGALYNKTLRICRKHFTLNAPWDFVLRGVYASTAYRSADLFGRCKRLYRCGVRTRSQLMQVQYRVSCLSYINRHKTVHWLKLR